MSRRRRERLRALIDEVARRYPHLDDPRIAIVAGNVLVDGIARTNPNSRVRGDASLRLREERPLRGSVKLRAALAAFAVRVRGRIALDIGASTGGFTRVLLDAGATRVYAVDAGHGQLLGSLRQDRRVVNLESTNVGDLDHYKIADAIDVVTIDLSYLSLRQAVTQLEHVVFAARADAIALVKPQFELGLSRQPETPGEFGTAIVTAVDAFRSKRWHVAGVVESPVRGAAGSVEFLLHAIRTG